jgi:AcrR family transcriptional regulator
VAGERAEAILTGHQAERRRRVVAAAMELGDEGGYEAVQMRDVASRANVAMGTVYRYFSSKDHLLAVALADWAEDLEAQLAADPPVGRTPADRVAQLFRRATRVVAEHMQLIAAMVYAISSADPGVVECQSRVSATVERMIRRAIGSPAPAEVDGICRILSHVWYATLLGSVNGWSNVGEMGEELALAARLLL